MLLNNLKNLKYKNSIIIKNLAAKKMLKKVKKNVLG